MIYGGFEISPLHVDRNRSLGPVRGLQKDLNEELQQQLIQDRSTKGWHGLATAKVMGKMAMNHCFQPTSSCFFC